MEDIGPDLTWKAMDRMLLAAGTSPASHLDFPPMSQSTSACGQCLTAFCSSDSRDSLVPCAFSKKAARSQMDFRFSYTDSAWAKMARAHSYASWKSKRRGMKPR